MSLEQVIADNTTAIHQLISVLGGKNLQEVSTDKPAKSGKKAEAPAETAKADTPAAQQTTETTKVYDAAAVKDLTLKLAEKNRAKAVEILAKYGAKKAPDLKPEQFAAYGADVEKELV